jgi:hypothetical protein
MVQWYHNKAENEKATFKFHSILKTEEIQNLQKTPWQQKTKTNTNNKKKREKRKEKETRETIFLPRHRTEQVFHTDELRIAPHFYYCFCLSRL